MRRCIGTPALLAVLVVALTGCNRDRSDNTAGDTSGSSGSGSKASYNIGGVVTGLTASGLSLATAHNMISVAAGATAFALPNLVATGTSYAVTVQSQPQGQTCALANGSGTVGQANITNVQVTCTTNTYSIGGTITGLSASGLVLSNGSDVVPVATGASTFLFPTKMAAGAAYAVAVAVQPIGLNCQVINAAGAMPFAALTNVMVACGQWAWISGAEQTGATGTYGAEGTPAASNVPGARAAATSWIDSSGTLWLFGGTGANGNLNDLWKYHAGAWTWVNGSASANATGHYGAQGVAASGNAPGARANASSWADSSGQLWLFGGQGYDSVGASGSLNDLWKYNISANQWTWISGSDSAWVAGTVPPGSEPGGRTGAVSWIDAAGSLWLFGGMGTQGLTNDLWKFLPNTTQWTLVSGSQSANAVGIYGTEGTAAAGNVPGSRAQAVASMDAAGDLWLFGGSGYGSIGSTGLLNDLWKFAPTTAQWTWVSGWKTVNAVGVYGTHSTTDIKQPGARFAASAATDAGGNLWLFGGVGYDAAGARSALNDMWEYNVGSAQWIWMGGSQTAGTTGVYGTQGIAAAGNAPGERSGAVSWTDGSGDFWLFGGQGWGAAQGTGMLNDLWEFDP